MTSPSRTPSRPSTPPNHLRPAASRFLSTASTLRPSTSVSSLHAHFESSKSVAVNSDEGILIRDTEQEVETGDGDSGTAVGHMSSESDEQTKNTLRDNLRRTLSGMYRTYYSPPHLRESTESPSARRSEKSRQPVDLEEHIPSGETTAKRPPREYYILTDSGKPVYTR